MVVDIYSHLFLGLFYRFVGVSVKISLWLVPSAGNAATPLEIRAPDRLVLVLCELTVYSWADYVCPVLNYNVNGYSSIENMSF